MHTVGHQFVQARLSWPSWYCSNPTLAADTFLCKTFCRQMWMLSWLHLVSQHADACRNTGCCHATRNKNGRRSSSHKQLQPASLVRLHVVCSCICNAVCLQDSLYLLTKQTVCGALCLITAITPSMSLNTTEISASSHQLLVLVLWTVFEAQHMCRLCSVCTLHASLPARMSLWVQEPRDMSL